jgi:hypothetical protein
VGAARGEGAQSIQGTGGAAVETNTGENMAEGIETNMEETDGSAHNTKRPLSRAAAAGYKLATVLAAQFQRRRVADAKTATTGDATEDNTEEEAGERVEETTEEKEDVDAEEGMEADSKAHADLAMEEEEGAEAETKVDENMVDSGPVADATSEPKVIHTGEPAATPPPPVRVFGFGSPAPCFGGPARRRI